MSSFVRLSGGLSNENQDGNRFFLNQHIIKWCVTQNCASEADLAQVNIFKFLKVKIYLESMV